MLNLDNSQKLVMGIMGAIATIAFGTAITLHCKDKKAEEADYQALLERVKNHVDTIYTILTMEGTGWWTTKPHDRVTLMNIELQEYMEAITESMSKGTAKRLEKEISEYVDMKVLQKKPESTSE